MYFWKDSVLKINFVVYGNLQQIHLGDPVCKEHPNLRHGFGFHFLSQIKSQWIWLSLFMKSQFRNFGFDFFMKSKIRNFDF